MVRKPTRKKRAQDLEDEDDDRWYEARIACVYG
jgi:hypothetical protein